MAEDWWLVLCRDHGVVDVAVETKLAAHRVADQHERPGCDLRILSEDQWSQLKLAGELAPPTGTNTAIDGP